MRFLIPVIAIMLFIRPAESKVADEIGFGLGMAMASYAEQESSLQGENIEEPASGSASQISGSLYWKFFHRDSYDLYLTSVFPLLGSADTSLVSGGLGAEWYFSRENHRLKENSEGFKLSVDPKLRYYLIGEANIVYLSYLTETSKKNDINFELGAGGGLSYSLGGGLKDWGLRASAVVGRGVGVITSTFNIKFFASVIYFLDI